MLLAELGQCVRELLDGRHDDALAVGDGLGELSRVLRPGDGVPHLHELLDGVAYLLVEDAPVGDDDHRVDHGPPEPLERDELVRKPGDGVRLAAARAVLDEVALADSVPAHVGEDGLHAVELVVAREYLLDGLLAGVRVDVHHDLGVVLDDAGELALGEDVLPEVVGHEPVGVGRVPRSVVVALVEGKEPAVLLGELRAELDCRVVNGEVDHAALE